MGNKKKKKHNRGEGKLIASASAPHSNYSEDLWWMGGRFNFMTRLNVDLSTRRRTQCLALRPVLNPAASCIHNRHTLTVRHAFCAHMRVTQRRTDESGAARGAHKHAGKQSARGPHETICHYTCMSARCGHTPAQWHIISRACAHMHAHTHIHTNI